MILVEFCSAAPEKLYFCSSSDCEGVVTFQASTQPCLRRLKSSFGRKIELLETAEMDRGTHVPIAGENDQ